MKGLTYFTIVTLSGDPRCYVRAMTPDGGYHEMGFFASPERAKAVVLDMYHTWAWQLDAQDFQARRDAAEMAVAV